jgi:hypothetical protein
MSCREYMYHTSILKFGFVAQSYVHTPSSQALSKSSIEVSMYTLILSLGYLEIINDTNMYCCWKMMLGGRLRGITNVVRPCFNIGWMCKVITVSTTHFVPSHLLRRFLGHEICWIRCMGGRYCRTLTGIVSYVYLPWPESISMNWDALHFG